MKQLIPTSVPIRELRIGSGLKTHATTLLDALSIGKKFTVVSDANTYAALGKNIEDQLPESISIVLPDGVKPTLETAEELQRRTAACDALIAVGSGTINDLCKYAAHSAGKPYAVFGTAPSMNGYTSANASLIVDGFRTSRMAQLPAGVFLDLDILTAAPKHLIQSGLGDALCRPTAQADWLLSHLLLGTPYSAEPFEMLKPYEEKLFASAEGLIKGDTAAIELLATSLVLSGIGMYVSGGSYPASQGEHMIAHTMEMVHGDSLPATFHGQEISVTTLTMARLQERILMQDTVQLSPLTSVPADYFGSLVDDCHTAYAKKLALMEGVNERLANEWPGIRKKIRAITLPASTLQKVLEDADAPTTSQALRWPEESYTQAVAHAKYSRDRFTFLDLV